MQRRRRNTAASSLAWCWLFASWIAQSADAQASFANVTLTANSGDLSVVVFLPDGVKGSAPTYYTSSRFDHGSMIGNIERTSRNAVTGETSKHILYGTKQWRVPHDPYWPESGVGLASEFGVGDDGAFCNYRCGWDQVNEVTNGVLGYQEAKNGEPFLKIGVGELVKGSCPTCDSTDDFKFNSPYQFSKPPVWNLEEDPDTNSIALLHEATLNQYGYKLRKDITLNDDVLLVKTTLTNAGRVPFATAWYSHHFFTCDAHPVGPGVGVDLDVAGTQGNYEEPRTWFWSTPLEDYATLKSSETQVSVEMNRGLDRMVRIKTEFTKDPTSRGSFTIHGCESSIRESIPEVGAEGSPLSMYAFNLYIESETFSPEPMIYMRLFPGQSTSWTQILEFSDYDESAEVVEDSAGTIMQNYRLGAVFAGTQTRRARLVSGAFVLFALTATICLGLCIQILLKRRRQQRHTYASIPEAVITDS